MLCGLVKPDGGGGTCFGLDILNDAPRIRLQVGYMTQQFSFYEDLTVGENLDFVAAVYYPQGKRWWVRLHEKGGKQHEMPAHHLLKGYLDEYVKAAGIGAEKACPSSARSVAADASS